MLNQGFGFLFLFTKKSKKKNPMESCEACATFRHLCYVRICPAVSLDLHTLDLVVLLKSLLDFVIQDKDEGTTSSTENVRESSLEESSSSFVLGNLSPAVEGTVVKLLLLSCLHHESSSHSIEWVGDDTTDSGDTLGDGPLGNNAGILLLFASSEQGSLSSVIQTKVSSSVDDDTLDGNSESLVQSKRTSLSGGLGQAVNKSGEFSGGTTSNISSQTSSCEIEWVDNSQRGGTSKTTTGQVGREERQELGLWVVLREESLDSILEGKVESLGREVSDDVRHVSSPEGSNTLLSGNTREAVDHTSVSWHFSGNNLWVSILSLDQELDSLDRGNESLGNSSRNTTGSEISEKLQGVELLVRSNHRRGGCEGCWLVIGLLLLAQGTKLVQGWRKHLVFILQL